MGVKDLKFIHMKDNGLRASPQCSVCDSDSKIYCKTIKMCMFSLGNWFFCTKFVQLAMAGNWLNTMMHLQKRV